MTNATLLDVRVPDPSFMDDYDTGARYVPPPQPKEWVDGKIGGKVKYLTFVAKTPKYDESWVQDEQGVVRTNKETGDFQPVLFGVTLPNNGGYEVRPVYLGTSQYKVYDRKTKQPIPGKFRNASPASDYFRAFGIDARPTTGQEYVDLLQATAERETEVQGDWEAYDSETKTTIAKKWEDFPDEFVNAKGDVVEATAEGAVKSGRKRPFIVRNGKNFWAKLSVKRWISQVKD